MAISTPGHCKIDWHCFVSSMHTGVSVLDGCVVEILPPIQIFKIEYLFIVRSSIEFEFCVTEIQFARKIKIKVESIMDCFEKNT